MSELIIEKTENGIYKMLNLSELPKKKHGGREVVDWKSCHQAPVEFQYDNIKATMRISFEKSHHGNAVVMCEFDGRKKIIRSGNLKKLVFKELVKPESIPQPTFEVGEIVNETLKIEEVNLHEAGVSYLVSCMKYPSAPPYRKIQSDLLRGDGSSYVRGLRVCKENSLYTERPELVRYFSNKEETKTISVSSNKRFQLQCPFCNYRKDYSVSQLSQRGFLCNHCRSTSSFAERVMARLLTFLGTEYDAEYIFPKNPKKRYDFYIESRNIIIEMHGSQHYASTAEGIYKERVEEIQENDRQKKVFCLKRGIKYLEINSSISTLNFVLGNVEKSGLLALLGKNKLQKEEFIKYFEHQESNFSLFMQCVQEYRSGVLPKKIAEKYNISSVTVYNYLKRHGVDVKDKRDGTQVVEVGSKIIYRSGASAARATKRTQGSVSYCIRKYRERKKIVSTRDGTAWMYYEDYVEKYGTEGLTEYVEEETHA